MSRSRVIGLDLSLVRTGIASYGWTDAIVPGKNLTGVERIADIGNQIVAHLGAAELVDLVVVEGPSYGSQAGQQGHHERAGLWWHVAYQLWRRDLDVAIVPPASLKQYATGRGNATKDEVLASACRQFPSYGVRRNDEADALWLCAMGLDRLGQPLQQQACTTVLRSKQIKAIGAVAWPDLEGVPA